MEVRHIGLDVVRAVAIMLVILQHCWSGCGMDAATGSWQYMVYKSLIIGVPLFVMLSGALQLGHVMPHEEFLRRRFTRLLVPFVIWATVVYVISAFAGKYAEVGGVMDALRMYGPYMLEGRVNQAYWFVYMIMGLYMVTPVLHRAFNPDSPETRRLLSYCLWLWGGFQAFKAMYPEMMPVGYYSFPMDVYLGYYLMGFYLMRYVSEEIRHRYGLMGFLLCLVVNVLTLRNGEYIPMLEIVEAVCLFMYLSTLDMLPGRQREIVSSMSRYSYVIYLTHVALVGLLCSRVHWTGAILPLAMTMVVAVLEYAFCMALERSRAIPGWVIGL